MLGPLIFLLYTSLPGKVIHSQEFSYNYYADVLLFLHSKHHLTLSKVILAWRKYHPPPSSISWGMVKLTIPSVKYNDQVWLNSSLQPPRSPGFERYSVFWLEILCSSGTHLTLMTFLDWVQKAGMSRHNDLSWCLDHLDRNLDLPEFLYHFKPPGIFVCIIVLCF